MLSVAPERFHAALSEFLRHKQQLLRRSRDGAVVCIGCNTGSQPCALSLVDGFTRAMAANSESRLGDCWASAVTYYYQRERLDKLVPTDSWYPASIFFQGMKFMFFGDPSLRLRVMPSIDGNEPAATGAKHRK